MSLDILSHVTVGNAQVWWIKLRRLRSQGPGSLGRLMRAEPSLTLFATPVRFLASDFAYWYVMWSQVSHVEEGSQLIPCVCVCVWPFNSKWLLIKWVPCSTLRPYLCLYLWSVCCKISIWVIASLSQYSPTSWCSRWVMMIGSAHTLLFLCVLLLFEPALTTHTQCLLNQLSTRCLWPLLYNAGNNIDRLYT